MSRAAVKADGCDPFMERGLFRPFMDKALASSRGIPTWMKLFFAAVAAAFCYAAVLVLFGQVTVGGADAATLAIAFFVLFFAGVVWFHALYLIEYRRDRNRALKEEERARSGSVEVTVEYHFWLTDLIWSLTVLGLLVAKALGPVIVFVAVVQLRQSGYLLAANMLAWAIVAYPFVIAAFYFIFRHRR